MTDADKISSLEADKRELVELLEAAEKKAATLPSSVALAYGLLWHMTIDHEDDNLRLASDARKALLSLLSKDEQAEGITWAKLTDARFTGAA